MALRPPADRRPDPRAVTVPVRISAPAAGELEAAIVWYDEQRPGLGIELFDAVVATLQRIEDNPAVGPAAPSSGLARRLLVDGFPYQLVYQVKPAEIMILAVAHLKRRPGYWRDRLGT